MGNREFNQDFDKTSIEKICICADDKIQKEFIGLLPVPYSLFSREHEKGMFAISWG